MPAKPPSPPENLGAVVALADPSTELGAFRREQAETSTRESLEELKTLHKKTRGRDGRIRRARFLSSVLALRLQGFKPKQTADVLGVSLQQVTNALMTVRQDHDIDALLERIDSVILPMAVDNAATGVMEGDKDYTLEMLRGRGILRTHKSIDAQVKKTVLTMQVVLTMPAHLEGKEPPMPRAGAIVGAPVDPSMLPTLPPAEVLEGVIVKTMPTSAGATVVAVKGPENLR